MNPNPANMPKPQPMHARRQGAYVTQSSGFALPTPPTVTPERKRTDSVTDDDGIVTTLPSSPKALRKSRGHMPGMAPTRRVSAPVVTRMATAADLARLGR